MTTERMTIPIPPDEVLHSAYESGRNYASHRGGLRAVATLAASQAAEQAVKEAVLRIDTMLDAYHFPTKGNIRPSILAEFGISRDATPTPPTSTFTCCQRCDGPFPAYGPHADYPELCNACVRQLGDSISTTRWKKSTPTPPKEQQPVTDTLGRTIWTRETGPIPPPSPDPATVRACIEVMRSCGCTEGEIACVESLLPKPTPAPEPERYVTVEEAVWALSNGDGWCDPAVNSQQVGTITKRLEALAAKRGPMITPEQAMASINPWFIGDDSGLRESLLAALRRAAKGGGQ